MALQFSVAFRNAMLDQFETVIGASPVLEIRSGAPPTNCAAADAGTLLASLALPADWMAAASGGTKALAGTWTDAAVLSYIIVVDDNSTAVYSYTGDAANNDFTAAEFTLMGTINAVLVAGDVIFA